MCALLLFGPLINHISCTFVSPNYELEELVAFVHSTCSVPAWYSLGTCSHKVLAHAPRCFCQSSLGTNLFKSHPPNHEAALMRLKPPIVGGFELMHTDAR